MTPEQADQLAAISTRCRMIHESLADWKNVTQVHIQEAMGEWENLIRERNAIYAETGEIPPPKV